MDSMLSALHKGYNKTFQQSLVVTLSRDLELMKMAAANIEVNDFEMATCQVVWEALLDYYIRFTALPDIPTMQLQVTKVVRNTDNTFKSYITPEEYEALSTLMAMLVNGTGCNPAYFKSELARYIKWVRSSKVMGDFADHVNRGGDPSVLTGRLTEIERTVDSAFITEMPFTLASSQPELITDETPVQRITTGIPRLDALTGGGLEPGEIGLITACPGVGKTNFLINFCVAANYSGIHSLFITLELSGSMIKRRYHAMQAGIVADRLKEPIDRWSEEDLMRLHTVLRKDYITHNKLAVTDERRERPTVTKIAHIVEHWKEWHRKTRGTDADALLVCVDWQKYVAPPKMHRKVEQWEESAIVLEELRRVGERYNVVIWTANQGKQEADGKAILGMKDTAFGFHANDPLDMSIGVSLGTDSRITEDSLDNEYAPSDRHMIASINKHRNGALAACEIYRAPTLRLFDSEAAYASYRAASRRLMVDGVRNSNLFDATLIGEAKSAMGEEGGLAHVS